MKVLLGGTSIPDIFTSITNGAGGEKNCHVENIFHLTDCHVEKFLHMRNMKKRYHIEKVLHMINVEQNVLCGEICHVEIGEMFPHDRFLRMTNEKCGANLFCGEISLHDTVLSQFTLFRRKICFVAIYALLCGEKLDQKLCLWRKKDKYQVWAPVNKWCLGITS